MIAEYSLGNVVWVDVQTPTQRDLQILRDRYNIHSEILNDLSSPTSDIKIQQFDHQLYLSFHNTHTFSLSKRPLWQEIDLVITNDQLVTVTYESVPAIESLRKELDIEIKLRRNLSVSVDKLLASLISKIHNDLRSILVAVHDHQLNIDERIFSGQERHMVRTISETGRILFSLNTTIAEQSHIIKFLPNSFKGLLKNSLSLWSRELDLTSDQTKAQYSLYHDLRRTNEELLSTRQNEVMRKLTLVAFITSPLTILAGIFGMNTKAMPLVNNPNDFWVVIGLMVMVIIVTVLALRLKGWFD